MKTAPEALHWLHRLDTYTNAEFGRARTLSGVSDECVGCGSVSVRRDDRGLCASCSLQRNADQGAVYFFRPVARRKKLEQAGA